jgi:hypothetical protein
MAIDAKSLARLRSGQTFDLYGEAVAGRPVALRDGDVVIVPAAKTRPPSWEAENRARWSGVALGSPSAEPSLPAHGAGPLLATRREARAWQRRGTSVLWLWSILLVLAAVTRLLATELPLWVLPVLGLAIVGAYGTLWRQTRLLDRLARRLPGPPPATRRARRAARAAVAARLSSEAGLAETASLLATTPQRLRARQRIGTGLVVGSIGLVTLLFVGAVLFPSAVDSLRPVRRPRPPIAGAPGYTTFTGPLGRPLAVGRPWGRACQPVLFSVGEGMPPDAYADVAAVVAEAKRQGLNVAVASLASTWFTGSPYYPPGLSADDVQPVRLTYDTDPPRKLANGKPVSVSYQWGARADPDGRHEILTGATGQLWLADLSSPIRRRNAIREIVAFTQGVSWPARSGPGLRRPGADAFNPPDIAAMQLMSGCGDSLVPHWSPPSPPTSVLTVAPAAN